MQEPKRHLPFKTLGSQLKFLREGREESLAEVSGAVEIDIEVLERIEQGEERPAEDILMLLINHFGMQDHEAVQLWESAGYDRDSNDKFPNFGDAQQSKTAMVLLAVDTRTMYSDGVDITANKSGVVIGFTQSAAQPNQVVPITRVGMSYEQAEQVLQALQRAVLYGRQGPRQLPPTAS